MRFELVGLARKTGVPHALIHITTGVKKCLELNEARGRKIPDEVIVKDGSRMDLPGEDPWDMPFASVEAPALDDSDIAGIAAELLAHAACHEPWAPPVKPEHVATRTEELDLLARRVVGELYKTSRPKADGKEVSRFRLELVRRACEDGLPDGEAEAYFHARLSSLFP
jgi:tRNA uridine 5-carbamoylmethylation protein Kti12